MRAYRSARRASEPLSVDAVAARVKKLIEYDETLARVTIEGELTELKRHFSGHVYFTLKGQKASMNCVIFRSDASGQLLWPQVGDRVLAYGSVRLYEDRSVVQLYAKKLYPLGQSAAARAKEELRLRLAGEGLFSADRKRHLPPYPHVVACVTSDSGAAVHDVMRQHSVRYPAAQLIVIPCLVQGLHAAESAAAALRRAGTLPGVEAVLLVRGGGAKEDLNPFDDEELVRAVYACPVPVVTGIGHEVDVSLCDLVADLCQPTPTAAAAAVFPDRRVDLAAMDDVEKRLESGLEHCVEAERQLLSQEAEDLTSILLRQMQNEAQVIDGADTRLRLRLGTALVSSSARLDGIDRALANLSPSRLAQRGYSLVYCGGKPLLHASDARLGDELSVQLLDGDLMSRVERVTSRE